MTAGTIVIELRKRGVDAKAHASSEPVPDRVLCLLYQCEGIGEQRHVDDRDDPPEIAAAKARLANPALGQLVNDDDAIACFGAQPTDLPTWPDPTARPRVPDPGAGDLVVRIRGPVKFLTPPTVDAHVSTCRRCALKLALEVVGDRPGMGCTEYVDELLRVARWIVGDAR